MSYKTPQYQEQSSYHRPAPAVGDKVIHKGQPDRGCATITSVTVYANGLKKWYLVKTDQDDDESQGTLSDCLERIGVPYGPKEEQ